MCCQVLVVGVFFRILEMVNECSVLVRRKTTFLVPMNSRCSTAWAIPGISSASLKLPTFTFTAALALSVSGSCTRRASSLFGSLMTLYDLSSRAGASSLSVTRSMGAMLAKERVVVLLSEG